MTLAPQRKPLAFGDVDDVAVAIREDGGRLSAACRIVLEALFSADGPVSAAYIAGGLDGRSIPSDLSSVYRNLERLEELGVVRHVHVGHGPGLYALESGTSNEYLVCERCDRVTSVDPSELDEIREGIRIRFGYEVRFSHFPIVGLCSACVGAGSGARPTHDEEGTDPTNFHEHSHGDYVHSHTPIKREKGHRHVH